MNLMVDGVRPRDPAPSCRRCRIGARARRVYGALLALVILTALHLAAAGRAAAAEPQIDPSFGTLSLIEQDLGEPIDVLSLLRVYAPRETEPGMLGRGWRLNWESRLFQDGPAIVHIEAGLRRRFAPDPGAAGSFRHGGGDAISAAPDSRWRLTRLDGTSDLFDSSGQLIERDLGNGNKVSLSYSVAGQVARIQGPFERGLTFAYGAGGRITQIETAAGERTTYVYSGERLSEVRSAGAAPVRYAYDPNGRLVRIEEPRWGVTELAYDGQGRVVSRRFPGGGEERFAYDDAARRVRHTDRHGGVTLRERSADGRREEMTDPLGQRSVTEVDEQGRAVRLTGAAGRTLTVEYDALGRIAAMKEGTTPVLAFSYLGQTGLPTVIADADGSRDELEYDDRRNLIRLRRDGEIILTATYLANGLVESFTEPGGRMRRFVYYPQGRIFSIADGLGSLTRMEYDRRGNVTRVTDAHGGSVQRSYDGADRLVSETDPAGATTRFEYDPNGRLIRAIDAGGAATTYGYDAAGQRTSITDAAGRQLQTVLTGRELALRGADGRTERLRFDPFGRPIEAIDPDGRVARFTYDASGQVTTVTGPGGIELRYRYNAQGRPEAIEDNLGARTAMQWDDRGRLTALTGTGGAGERYAYDPAGRLASITDALGNRTQHAYDAARRLNAVTSPSGDRARFAFDRERRLTALWDPAGRQTQFAYDVLDRLVEVNHADGRLFRSTYDSASRLIAMADRAGRTTRFDYDAAGRLATKTLPGGRTLRYRYTPTGEPVEIDDGVYPLRYDYDRQGRLTAIQHGALRKAVRYAYDGEGRLAGVTGTADQGIRYRYDAGRLVAIDLPAGGAIELAYDAADRLQAVRYPNGTSGTWRYDPTGRVADIVHRFPQGLSDPARQSPTLGVAYVYDAAGNPLERRGPETGQGRRYRYDADGRLIEEKAISGTPLAGTPAAPALDVAYAYRPGGDRAQRVLNGTTEVYVYDQGGRIQAAGAERFAHDPHGNPVRREASAGVSTYAWDDEGRLSQAEIGGALLRYGYAPTGERISRRDRSGAITRFVYDRHNLLEELAEDGRLRALYVHAPGIDRPLAMIRDGQTFFYHADPLGTVLFLTDASGRIAASYDTDAFGNVLRTNVAPRSPAGANPFIFTGREYEADLKLYYFRARYYDPGLGRFLSPDPLPGTLDSPASLNRYVYALNAPTRNLDPMGTAPAPDVDFYQRNGFDLRTVHDYLKATTDQLQARGMTPAAALQAAEARIKGAVAGNIPVNRIQATMARVAASAPAGGGINPNVISAAEAVGEGARPPPPSAPPPAPPPAAMPPAAAAPAAPPGMSWSDALRKVSADPKAAAGILGTAGQATLLGGFLGFADPRARNLEDRTWNAATGAARGLGVGFTAEFIKQTIIARYGTEVAARVLSPLGAAGNLLFGGVLLGQLGYINHEIWGRAAAVNEQNRAIIAQQTNPIFTDESVGRLINGLREQLAALRGIHGELTQLAAALTPGGQGGQGGADPLAGARSKLDRLKAMAAGPDANTARALCTQLGPFVRTIEQAATIAEAKAQAASAILADPGDWPASRGRLDQAFAQMADAAAAARNAKTARENLGKALATLNPAGPEGTEAARKLGEEIGSEIDAAEAALRGGLGGMNPAQMQLDAAKAAEKKRQFEGLRASLLVSVERVKISVPPQFQYAWADANDVAVQAQGLAIPAVLSGDPGRGAADQFVAETTKLRGEVGAALQAARTAREICPGLPQSAADLEQRGKTGWDKISLQARTMLNAVDVRAQHLNNLVNGMAQLQRDNTRQIGDAEAKLRTALPPAEKTKAERIIREAQQGNVDAAELQKKAREELSYNGGKAGTVRSELAAALQ